MAEENNQEQQGKVLGTPEFPLNTHPGNQPDEYVRCPYFPEHELRKSRLPYHLIKCQQNPRAPKLLACPYNYLHRIAPEDCSNHAMLCKDRNRPRYIDRKVASYARTRKVTLGVKDPLKSFEVRDVPMSFEIEHNRPKTDNGEDWWD